MRKRLQLRRGGQGRLWPHGGLEVGGRETGLSNPCSRIGPVLRAAPDRAQRETDGCPIGQNGGMGASGPAFDVEAEVMLWEVDPAYHYLPVPVEESNQIAELMGGRTRGFGTVPVEATIGSTTWRTSLLRDADNGCYLLLLKKAVRAAEGLAAGSRARVRLEPVDSLP